MAGATSSTGEPAQHDPVLSAVPSSTTPSVSDGKVLAAVRVGELMVIGGTFTELTPPGGAPAARTHVAAFNANTGELVPGFAPVVNEFVTSLEAGPTPGTVYLGGKFTTIDGTRANRVALLDVSTGLPVAGFHAPSSNGKVNTIARHGSHLILGGDFTTLGSATRAGFGSLNAATGATDSFVTHQVAERHNYTGTGAAGPIGVRQIDISPDGDRLVAIGNFRKVDGLDRDQIVMLTLGETASTVTADWHTSGFKPLCYPGSFDSYVRDVAFSPGGDFFVVASTGGGVSGTLCDAAARFETYGSGTERQPTWVNASGGDTLWAVEVTDHAVYVGGHQRWMNNPLASDRPGAGAVPRPGLAALDLVSGLPLAWNPGRNPRGTAVYELYADRTGLWMGSDTEYVGNRTYKRPRLAKFDLTDETGVAPDFVASMPGDLMVGGSSGDSLASAHFTGADPGEPASTSGLGLAWGNVRAGAFLAGGYLYYGWTDNTLYRRAYHGDALGNAEPVTPYIDPVWDSVSSGTGGLTYRGAASNFHTSMATVTGMAYRNGRLYYTRSNQPRLFWRWFSTDSGVVGAEEFVAGENSEFADSTGLVLGEDVVYYAHPSGGGARLQSHALVDGKLSGTPSTVSHGNYHGKALFLASSDAVRNDAPKAQAAGACTELTCTFDSSGSTDSDGSIVAYAWDFGEGQTSAAPAPSHTVSSPGPRTVTLTVTDNLGATDSATIEVSPAGSDISFVAAESAARNVAQPSLVVPDQVQPGDTLVMTLGVNSDSEVQVPNGWRLVQRATANWLAAEVWTRTATATDAGSTVSLGLPYVTKSSMSIAAYRGVDPTEPVLAFATNTDASTQMHTSPRLNLPSEAWVLSLYVDKGPSTSAWDPPTATQVRARSFSAGSGRVSSLLVDSGGAKTGSVGGLVASTDATSARGINWTIALRP